MTKRFKNIHDMIRGLSENKDFADSSIKVLENKRLSKFLFFLRCEKKLTQKELATKLKCSQGRISKIEHSYDNDLTIRDFLDYGNALGLQLEIGYRQKNVKIVDLIKFHAFKIDKYLKQLTNIAKTENDETIINGVSAFCQEALSNISHLIIKQLSHLNVIKTKNITINKPKEIIHISPPINEQVVEKDRLEKVEL